jgi:hypothetical protein
VAGAGVTRPDRPPTAPIDMTGWFDVTPSTDVVADATAASPLRELDLPVGPAPELDLGGSGDPGDAGESGAAGPAAT